MTKLKYAFVALWCILQGRSVMYKCGVLRNGLVLLTECALVADCKRIEGL